MKTYLELYLDKDYSFGLVYRTFFEMAKNVRSKPVDF